MQLKKTIIQRSGSDCFRVHAVSLFQSRNLDAKLNFKSADKESICVSTLFLVLGAEGLTFMQAGLHTEYSHIIGRQNVTS